MLGLAPLAAAPLSDDGDRLPRITAGAIGEVVLGGTAEGEARTAAVSPVAMLPVGGELAGVGRIEADGAGPVDVADAARAVETVVAVAMSEPDAGSALTDLKTQLSRTDGRLLLNGNKRWSSGAGHSEAYVVYSRMDDSPGAKSIGAVVVEKGAAGFSFGKRDHHMGFRGVYSADMYFDNVEIREEDILVPAGGFSKLMDAFDLERCGNTTMSLATAQSAFDYVLHYVQEREQFGKALVDFQGVQIQIAEMKMKLEAARLLLYRAVINAESGLPSIAESSVAKCFANETAREVTGKCVQLMGGYGYSKEYPLEQKMRDAWGWGIAGGAIDIQKVNITAALVGRRFNQRA